MDGIGLFERCSMLLSGWVVYLASAVDQPYHQYFLYFLAGTQFKGWSRELHFKSVRIRGVEGMVSR